MNSLGVRRRFERVLPDAALLVPLGLWFVAVAFGLWGAYGLMSDPLSLLAMLDRLFGVTVCVGLFAGLVLMGLFLTRGRQRLGLSAHALVYRDSLAFGLWFAMLSLGLSGLLLGACRSLIWFFGPYPWVAMITAVVFTCTLPLNAGWIPLGGLPTLGLLWRTPMPSRKLGLLPWLGACLVLLLRYRQGRVADSEASRPVLAEITRTLDLARRGGSERGANLWDSGFARWRAELQSRLLALGWIALSAAVASGLLFVALPSLKVLPPFQAAQTRFGEPEALASAEKGPDPAVPEWAQKPDAKTLPSTDEKGDAATDRPATHSGEGDSSEDAGTNSSSDEGSTESQTSSKEQSQGGEGEGQPDQAGEKGTGDSGAGKKAGDSAAEGQSGQGNQPGESGAANQGQGNQLEETRVANQGQGNQPGETGKENQGQGNQPGETGKENQGQGNQPGETGKENQGQGNQPGETGKEKQGQGNQPGEDRERKPRSRQPTGRNRERKPGPRQATGRDGEGKPRTRQPTGRDREGKPRPRQPTGRDRLRAGEGFWLQRSTRPRKKRFTATGPVRRSTGFQPLFKRLRPRIRRQLGSIHLLRQRRGSGCAFATEGALVRPRRAVVSSERSRWQWRRRSAKPS